jgi:hypothetical protein
VSCAWFFEDIDRLEPRIALSYAHRAASLALQHAGINLTPAFAADLAASRSWRTGRTAADFYATFAQSVSAVA